MNQVLMFSETRDEVVSLLLCRCQLRQLLDGSYRPFSEFGIGVCRLEVIRLPAEAVVW